MDNKNSPDSEGTSVDIVKKSDSKGDISAGIIENVSLVDEMENSYLDYAMSVIVSRALPDVRDGLKPVHRRILFAMNEGGYTSSKPFRKSARIVGDVIGKYHPHGDSAIYNSLVRMAQDFSLRSLLIEGQGNFGSIDKDPPAAMRYTEARLTKLAETLLSDIDYNTVDFQANYDNSEFEPKVLPARFPNLIINGTEGIAVGMASTIPPHNPTEVLLACLELADNPDITLDDLMKNIKGPDFPTGGEIVGTNGIKEAYATGRGIITLKGVAEVLTKKNGRNVIEITEIPYQVNKAALIDKIAEMVRDKRIEGISDLRDLSNRQGIKIVIELKKDAISDLVLRKIYKFTQLKQSVGINMIALCDMKPEVLGLKSILANFIKFRDEVIYKRALFHLKKAQEKAHTNIGLIIAVGYLDEVIEMIKTASDIATAKQRLLDKDWNILEIKQLIALIEDYSIDELADIYKLSEIQAKTILEIRLQKLTALERDKLKKESEELVDRIKECKEIIFSKTKRTEIFKQEINEILSKHSSPRYTKIVAAENEEITFEELIVPEDMLISLTKNGFIKRVKLNTYRSQRRGGKGRNAMTTRVDDFVIDIIVANTRDAMLFFTDLGKVYVAKTYQIPEAQPQSKGRSLKNFLMLSDSQNISTVMKVSHFEDVYENMIFATSGGQVRRNSTSDFKRINSNGKIAIKLNDGEKLINVKLAKNDANVLLATRFGMMINFDISQLRVIRSRNSFGVKGINLRGGDEVVSMLIIENNSSTINLRQQFLKGKALNKRKSAELSLQQKDELAIWRSSKQMQDMLAKERFIFTVSSLGMGKKSSIYEYTVIKRAGRGVVNINVASRADAKSKEVVVASFEVTDSDQILLVTQNGQMIRFSTSDIRSSGRNTKGVKIFSLSENDIIVSATKIAETIEL